MKKYVIIGATGHTGKPAATGLLEKGHEVRIVTRDAGKAADLIGKGAKHYPVAITDIEGLKKAFSGADAAYVMIPGDVRANDIIANQAAMVDSIAKALENSGIGHVVTLSSIGAHLLSGAGIVQGLQKMEAKLNAIPRINVLHLRPTYFFENTLSMAGMAKHMGIIGSPVHPDMEFPLVTTHDISQVVYRHLLALDFTGKTHEYILGARDYTYTELAKIFGHVIGKPDLKYVEFPFEDASKAMVQMGLGQSYVNELLDFVKSLNDGKVLSDRKRTAANTTPTTAEQFAKTWKAAYDAS